MNRTLQTGPAMWIVSLATVISTARLCENTVHGSTRLTTNGVVSLEIEYLSVRPEHRRRAPREFSHSLTFEMTDSLFSCHSERKRGIFLTDQTRIETETITKSIRRLTAMRRRKWGQVCFAFYSSSGSPRARKPPGLDYPFPFTASRT